MNYFPILTKVLFFSKIFILVFVLFAFSNSVEDVSQTLRNSVHNSYYVITTPKVWTSSQETVCLVLLKQFSLPNGVINVEISSLNGKDLFVQKYQSLNSRKD